MANVEQEKTNHDWYELDNGLNGQIFLLISISGRSISTGSFSSDATGSDSFSETRMPLNNYVQLNCPMFE